MDKVGANWSKASVLILTVSIYLITFLINPADAKTSIVYSLREIRKLLIPLLAAIFVGATVKNLITKDLISKIFDGNRGILAAGTLGSILPPCPFVSYPTIKGFNDGGLKLPKILIMLVATTLVETSQLFCGLAVFGPKIVGLRIGFAFIAVMIVSVIFYSIVSFREKIQKLFNVRNMLFHSPFR